MKNTNIIVILLAIMIYNCSTPYQKKGLLGGYTEEKIQDGIYRVTFDGNQHTDEKKVQKYLLYRCAEITAENGFGYFQIIDEEFITKINSVRPEARVQGKSVSDGFGGRKYIIIPNFGNSTKSTTSENTFLIKMEDKVNLDNYKNTFDAKKLIAKLDKELFNN